VDAHARTHAPVKGESSGEAADAAADNDDAMAFLLHLSSLFFLAHSPCSASSYI
jgi:hypothetical protein